MKNTGNSVNGGMTSSWVSHPSDCDHYVMVNKIQSVKLGVIQSKDQNPSEEVDPLGS